MVLAPGEPATAQHRRARDPQPTGVPGAAELGDGGERAVRLAEVAIQQDDRPGVDPPLLAAKLLQAARGGVHAELSREDPRRGLVVAMTEDASVKANSLKRTPVSPD